MTTESNRLQRQLARFQPLPASLRPGLVSLILGRVVPFVGTAGLRFEELTDERVVVSLRNRRRVQNHIHGVHAAATALLAETATGFCLGMHLPDGRLPLLKALRVDYLQRAVGDLRAVARLAPEQRALVRSQEKGEVTVAVVVTDAAGAEPVRCELVWAWVPPRR